MNNSDIRTAVWGSVGYSVWDSVRHSVRRSVRASVCGSVRASVRDYFSNKTNFDKIKQ